MTTHATPKDPPSLYLTVYAPPCIYGDDVFWGVVFPASDSKTHTFAMYIHTERKEKGFVARSFLRGQTTLRHSSCLTTKLNRRRSEIKRHRLLLFHNTRPAAPGNEFTPSFGPPHSRPDSHSQKHVSVRRSGRDRQGRDRHLSADGTNGSDETSSTKPSTQKKKKGLTQKLHGHSSSQCTPYKRNRQSTAVIQSINPGCFSAQRASRQR